MGIARILKHWLYPPWRVHQHFPNHSMSAVAKAIADSERSHLGEICFAVEGALPWREVLQGIPAHRRAVQMFSELHIWDTEHNTGVLIYLLLADRDVEIVADRGIHARVGTEGWEAICREMEEAFRQGHFERGVLLGIERITAILRQHDPAPGRSNPNELPDEPVVV